MGRRIVAFILDVVFIGVIWVAELVIFAILAALGVNAADEITNPFLGLTAFLYRPVTTYALGRTPAKRVLDLWIVDYPSDKETWGGQLLGREISFVLIALIPFGSVANLITMLASSERRGIHDGLSSTRVIHARKRD